MTEYSKEVKAEWAIYKKSYEFAIAELEKVLKQCDKIESESWHPKYGERVEEATQKLLRAIGRLRQYDKQAVQWFTKRTAEYENKKKKA